MAATTASLLLISSLALLWSTAPAARLLNGTDPFQQSLIFTQYDPFLGSDIQWIGATSGGKWQDLILYREGKFLTKIGCWSAGNMIKAVRLWFTNENDDQAHTYGDIGVAGTGPYAEYTFQPGELVNRMSLWGNGAGERLGWIYFTTSTGGKFDFGMYKWGRKREYFVETYGGRIAGAIIRYDVNQLYALGFYFHNEITSSEISVDRYDTLSANVAQLVPVWLDTRLAENALNTSSMTIYTHEYTETTKHEFELSNSKLHMLGGNVNFNAELAAVEMVPMPVPPVPPVLKATSTMEEEGGGTQALSFNMEGRWAFGNKQITDNKTETTMTHVYTETVNTTANMTSRLDLLMFQGTIARLPYAAQVKVSIKDGSSYSYPEKGWYSATVSSMVYMNLTLCDRYDTACIDGST